MQQQPRLPLWFLVANWALIAAAFVLGATLAGRRGPDLPEPQRSALELVYHEVLQSHIEPPDEHELLERAIAGMVDGLDRYSRYVPPARVAAYDEANTGLYQGIGATIRTRGDVVFVHFPLAGGPAERSGLMPGDRLLAVDGTPLDTPERRAEIVQLVRGPADTTVRLSIERDGTVRDIEVARGDVQQPCVRWVHFADPDAGLGYLQLTDFHPTAAQQVLAAIEQLERERPLRGLIVDLRSDGGGSLDECLTIARTFLPSGIIATQLRRAPAPTIVYEAEPKLCRYPDLPLVLLVDGGSASASEVLAGALQDHGRAAIVGQRTLGKGYVNTVYSWQHHAFKLKLTTGSYRTPSGRNIERNQSTHDTPADQQNGGIVPDVDVPVDQATHAAIQVHLASAEPAEQFRQAAAAVARKYDVPVPEPPRAATDPQFAAALAALRERAAAAPPRSPAAK